MDKTRIAKTALMLVELYIRSAPILAESYKALGVTLLGKEEFERLVKKELKLIREKEEEKEEIPEICDMGSCDTELNGISVFVKGRTRNWHLCQQHADAFLNFHDNKEVV